MVWKCPPIGSWIWTLAPWLVVLFGEIIEPLEDGDLMKEVCHLGWALVVYNLALLLILSLHPVYVWNVISQFSAPAVSSMLPSPPLLWWTLSHWKYQSKQALFSPKFLFVRILYLSNGKVINIEIDMHNCDCCDKSGYAALNAFELFFVRIWVKWFLSFISCLCSLWIKSSVNIYSSVSLLTN